MANCFNKNAEALLNAILSLENLDEAKRFFRDLLTEKEIVEFGNRWRAARMLAENVPYTRIQKVTGLSSTTVARISGWLNNGKGGYKLVLARQKNNSNKSKKTDASGSAIKYRKTAMEGADLLFRKSGIAQSKLVHHHNQSSFGKGLC